MRINFIIFFYWFLLIVGYICLFLVFWDGIGDEMNFVSLAGGLGACLGLNMMALTLITASSRQDNTAPSSSFTPPISKQTIKPKTNIVTVQGMKKEMDRLTSAYHNAKTEEEKLAAQTEFWKLKDKYELVIKSMAQQ